MCAGAVVVWSRGAMNKPPRCTCPCPCGCCSHCNAHGISPADGYCGPPLPRPARLMTGTSQPSVHHRFSSSSLFGRGIPRPRGGKLLQAGALVWLWHCPMRSAGEVECPVGMQNKQGRSKGFPACSPTPQHCTKGRAPGRKHNRRCAGHAARGLRRRWRLTCLCQVGL